MKEFTSQTGGRYTYIDDIINLQDLALAFTSLFDGCDNFIISGCQVSGTTISAGYVYINGKVRYCAGTSNASKWPMYIYESNSVENVSYADAADKKGRNIYGCAVASSVPVVNDSLTGAVPQSIPLQADGTAVRLKDALFGKYALMIDSPYPSQTVKKNVSFEGDVATNTLTAKQSLNITSGTSKATISYNAAGVLTIQSKLNNKLAYKIVITEDGAFQFYTGDTLIASLDAQGVVLNVSTSSNNVKGGNILVSGNDIYNTGVANNTGALNINMLGYNGASTYYRNTVIGNGKNEAVLSIVGSTKASTFYGAVGVSCATSASFMLQHSSLAKTDKTLQNYVVWKDKSSAEMAVMGYTSTTTYDWYIENKIGNIVLNNNVYVQGNLYVNGVNITSTYATTTSLNQELLKKANSADVYSKTVADSRFVKITDSINIFVTQAGGGETGKAAVRNAIGACSSSDLDKAVMKSQLFKDIVNEGLPEASDTSYASSLTARKRALCANIGAAYVDDVQTQVKDTGWIAMTVKNCGITTKLYVRQVGYVVSIQGELHTHHSGTIFTLPNSIDPPKYKIGFSHNKDGEWHCIINGNSRDCVVDHCDNGCSEYIGFLMTYII